MKIAVINRGVVGSGKSSFAQMLQQVAAELKLTCNIHNTDEYFMEDGEYKFDFTKLGINHKRNFNAFVNSLKLGLNVVVCDNTNTTAKEYKRYVNEAKEHGYSVVSVVFIPDNWEVHNERNSHNVPEEVIGQMIHRLNNNLKTAEVDYEIKFKPNAPYHKFSERLKFLADEVLVKGDNE